jgi:CRP-like cAMP-binding protein
MSKLQNIFIDKIGLSEEDLVRFNDVSTLVDYKKKDFLIKEGVTCKHIGFVESGIIRSFIQKEGEELNNAFYLPNSFFSAYSSFTKQRPAVSNLQAMDNSTVRLITFQQLNKLYQTSANWYKLGKYISDEFFFRKCERETSLLRETASERYISMLKLYPNIEQLVPQYQIASYLNIKPESLSRIKSLTYINK